MLCYLYHARLHFLLLLLLIFTCVSCGDVKAASGDLAVLSSSAEGKSVDLFKPGNIDNVLSHDESIISSGTKINVKNFKTPFLFAVDDMMFAFAVVNYSENAETKNKLIAKYIETNKNNWGESAVKSALNEWKTQLVTNKYDENENINFAFAVKETVELATEGKNIYLFAVDTVSSQNVLDFTTSSSDKNLKLVVGTFTDNTQNSKIKWEKKDLSFMDVTSRILETYKDKSQQMDLSGGFAFVTKDGNITVLLSFAIKDDEHKNVITVNQVTDNNLVDEAEKEMEINALHVDIIEDLFPYFFQWNEKVMMVLTEQKNTGARQMVKEFNFTTNKWEESKESIARLSDFLKDKRDFTTARIGSNKKSVLLFTQHKTKSGGDDGKNKKDVHLWVTDGDHLSDVGTVAANIDGGGDYYYYGSILHTNDELFILQQKYDNGKGVDDTFELTRLKEQLEEIKKLLESWKKADELVLKLCGEKDKASATALCAAQLTTDGLVGFLSNSTNESKNEWMDEYYYTNATMTGEAEKVENGFKFSGAGAGAKWSVGKTQEEDQPYNFTKYGFTLVATVTIGENKGQKNNSVLGVALSDNKNNNIVGLWCTKDNKWGVSGSDDKARATQNQSCEQGKMYTVTLVLEGNNNFAVYVDGEQLSDNKKDFTVNTNFENIAYFYFGVDNIVAPPNTIESHLTVRNVLLYNRPFTEDEIGKPTITKKEKQEEKETREDVEAAEPPRNKNDKQTNTQMDEKTTGSSSDVEPLSESNVAKNEESMTTNEENITTSSHLEESALHVSVLSLVTLLCLCAHMLWIL